MNIERRFFDLIKFYNLTVSTAESCTGGLVASKIVNISGVSEYYPGGFVTYSNFAKSRLCNVNKITLAIHTAVSPEVCAQMAKGAAKALGARVGISTTGEAGPLGGTVDKPVGLVYLGCSIDGLSYVKECHFKGDRNSIREQAAREALKYACRCIIHVMSM